MYEDLIVMMQGDHEIFGIWRSAADTTLNYHISTIKIESKRGLLSYML